MIKPNYPGESIDSLLRRFKKDTHASGVLDEFRRREYYSKPSERRRSKSIAARKRAAR